MYPLINKTLFKTKFNEIFNFIMFDVIAFFILSFSLYNQLYFKLNSIAHFHLVLDNIDHSVIILKFGFLYLTVSIFAFIFILFSFNKRNEYLFLGSQPTTKPSIAFTKLTLLLSILFINLLIIFFTVFIFTIKNGTYLQLFNIHLIPIIPKLFLILLTFSLGLISVLLLLTYFINNGILNILISGFILIYVPLMISLFKSIMHYPNGYFSGYLTSTLRPFNYAYIRYSITNNFLYILAFFILFLAFLTLCVKVLYKNIKLENFGTTFYCNGFFIFLKLLVCSILSLAFMLFIITIFRLNLNTIAISISCIALFIACFILLDKFSKKYLFNLI